MESWRQYVHSEYQDDNDNDDDDDGTLNYCITVYAVWIYNNQFIEYLKIMIKSLDEWIKW